MNPWRLQTRIDIQYRMTIVSQDKQFNGRTPQGDAGSKPATSFTFFIGYVDAGLHGVNINSLYNRIAYVNHEVIVDAKYDYIDDSFWIVKSEHASTDEFFKNILVLVLESPFDYIDINPAQKFGVEMTDRYEKFGIQAVISYPNLVNDFFIKFMPKPKKVYFKNPYTIVIWEDNTKTIVKCGSDDEYNKLTGYLLCFFKRVNGNDSSTKYQKKLKEIGAYE